MFKSQYTSSAVFDLSPCLQMATGITVLNGAQVNKKKTAHLIIAPGAFNNFAPGAFNNFSPGAFNNFAQTY